MREQKIIKEKEELVNSSSSLSIKWTFTHLPQLPKKTE